MSRTPNTGFGQHSQWGVLGPLKQRLSGRHSDKDADVKWEKHGWLQGLNPKLYCNDMDKNLIVRIKPMS
ncbi:hypothetical protein L798_12242 [Zootermopsis nevadensis]|uniref:Uncharacterized protein n=1 Tax=Zootermopsis nevadensis TaxID=136037 RepID=A0A067QU05_ZOONE|nr:hypothetical protein L798_12242 [Zootermopsis nevadensis]